MVEGSIVIFVAGYADLYPVEYFEAKTQTTEGILPGLLRDFSESSDYKIQYYQSSATDRRLYFKEQKQVDAITMSGERTEQEFSPNQILLFQSEQGGATYDYWLELTETAPAGFAEAFRTYAEQLTAKRQIGVTLQTLREPMNAKVQQLTLWLTVLTTVALVLGILCAYFYRKSRCSKVLEQSNHYLDQMTGIGNAEYIRMSYMNSLSEQQRILYGFYYIMVDAPKIERLQGRSVLQGYLQHIALVLQKHITIDDYLGRINDRTFALFRMSGNEEEVKQWLSPVLREIRDFRGLSTAIVQGAVAVGIYPLTSLINEYDELLYFTGRTAEIAYDNHEDYRFCDDLVERNLNEERELQNDLERAIEEKELELYIQFYVDAHSECVVGGEALIRWEHPEKGFLLPARFVPLMEREGFVHQMDYLMLEKVCQVLEELHRKNKKDFFISCNFSRKTFASENFVERCSEKIMRYEFDRRMLIMEMTESASTSDFTIIIENATKMKAMGLRIALDDFGEKFTSFFDLQEYPVDIIKLDKRLIDNIQTPKGRAILRGMVQVGHDVGLLILAEGVEEEEQVHALREINCDIIQGYHYHYPIPAWSAKKKLLL